MSVDNLLARLDGVRSTGAGKWRARCPAHDGKSLNLSIGEADTGTVLIYCFAGCGVANVLAAIGLQFSDLYPPDIHTRRYDTRPRKDMRATLHRLSHSATVVQVAAEHIDQGKVLSDQDMHELRQACEAIREAAL